VLGTICSIDRAITGSRESSQRSCLDPAGFHPSLASSAIALSWTRTGVRRSEGLSNQSEGIRTCSCAFAFPSTDSPSHSGRCPRPSSSRTLECSTKQRHMPIEGMRLWQTDAAPAFGVLNPHAGAGLPAVSYRVSLSTAGSTLVRGGHGGE